MGQPIQRPGKGSFAPAALFMAIYEYLDKLNAEVNELRAELEYLKETTPRKPGRPPKREGEAA